MRGMKMNSVERINAALSLKVPDRVPVAPSLLTRPVRRAGVRQYDYHTNPAVLADAQIAHCDAYDFDGFIVSSDNVIMYEAMGGRIAFHDDHSYPFWTDPLIKHPRNAARLSIPAPATAGRMPMMVEASRLAYRKVGNRRFIMTNIDSGPFQLAATIMGMEAAMTALVDDPDGMQDVLRLCADVAISYGTAMAASGCHGIQFGESTAGVLGRRFYEEYIFPHDLRVVGELKKTGTKVFLHVCGDSSAIIDLMAATGADCLEIDSMVDLAAAKRQVGGKVALKGNVNTTSFLGSDLAAFDQECREAIAAGMPGGGFILCGGCEVPADSSDEILHAFRRSADLYGTYERL